VVRSAGAAVQRGLGADEVCAGNGCRSPRSSSPVLADSLQREHAASLIVEANVWWLLAQAVVEVLIAGSAAGSVAKQLERRDRPTVERDRRALALFAFMLIGLIVGAISGSLVPHRILPARLFTGVSLVAVPLVLGAGMEWARRTRNAASSHLVTWYGGATLGLGLAVGRLLVLWRTSL